MRKILLLLLLLFSVPSRAEDFKILFVNTESIKIGRKSCVVGDVFSDSEKIYWKDAKQAMKVISLDSHKQYIFVKEDFKHRKMKSAKDFIVKNNRLSTRGSGSLTSVRAQIGDMIYWLNPTLVTLDYELDDNEFFFFQIGDRTLALEMDGSQLILDERIWGDGDRMPIEADLYIEYADGEKELVSSGVLIIPLPDVLRKKR